MMSLPDMRDCDRCENFKKWSFFLKYAKMCVITGLSEHVIANKLLMIIIFLLNKVM